jgi:hypothetical protein
MDIISITIKPLGSGCTVRVTENIPTKTQHSTWHDHAFSKTEETIEFVQLMLLNHEKTAERRKKS